MEVSKPKLLNPRWYLQNHQWLDINVADNTTQGKSLINKEHEKNRIIEFID